MKNFLVVWVGQLVSILGSGMVGFGLGVWIYMETGRATPFAISVFLGTLPAVILAPIAGVLADRFSRKLIMILADSASALASVFLLYVIMYSELQVHHIYILSFASSIGRTFQEPAYGASIPMMVPKNQLGRANGLNMASHAVGELLPPLAGGLLFGTLGLGGLIVIDLITFAVAVGSIMLVRIPMPERTSQSEEKSEPMLRQLSFGFRYLAKYPGFIGILVMASIANFLLNFAMVVLIPYVMSFSGTETLGIIQTIAGAGMLTGSLIIGMTGTGPYKIRILCLALALAGVGLATMGILPNPVFAGIGIFILLFMIPVASSHSMEIWQTKIEVDKQGRLAAARSAVSQALMPIGVLIAGPLADHVFVPAARTPARGMANMFVAAGLLLVIVVFVSYLHGPTRRVETDIPDVLLPS